MSRLREIGAKYGVVFPYCGDSACIFGSKKGLQTNGGCRCDEKLPRNVSFELRSGIAALIQLVYKLEKDMIEASWSGG